MDLGTIGGILTIIIVVFGIYKYIRKKFAKVNQRIAEA